MRTKLNYFVAILLSTTITTGLNAQDSIEEITVTSSYINQSADEIKDPLHVISEKELDTRRLLYESFNQLLRKLD